MRVADKMAFDQVNANISRNRTEMAQLQNQAATQKRVTKPSDDPVAASRVLFSRTEQRGNEQFIKNLNYARGFLDFSEQSLGELSELVMRAKELALSQANDASGNAQSRRVVAAEVRQLHDQAIQIGNRKLGERFIFGGFKTTEAPFDQEGRYTGDKGEMKLHIDKDSFLAMNMPGSSVFLGDGFSASGTPERSPQQPTTVEELWQMQAKEQGRAMQEASQAQIQQAQDQQQQPVEGRAPASLRVPNVAAEPTEYHRDANDGVNIFNALEKLETSMMANDKYGVQESLDRLDDALQQVILARTTLGSRVMVIDKALDSLHTIGVDTKTRISQLEDADVFQVISDMNKTESTLQATLQTSGKLVQKSLMDFIS